MLPTPRSSVWSVSLTDRGKLAVNYVPEPKLGLHNARHAGAHVARGQILVFTDDDATFDARWLRAYATAFEAYPKMVAAGGPVRPVWEAPPPKWLLDYMGDAKYFGPLSLMEPFEEFCLGPDAFFWGVNMAIRRDALFSVGGFNPESFGKTWLGDGESGLRRKLWEREMLIGYVPDALVYHHVPPERMTVRYLCTRMGNEGACEIYAKFHKGLPHWFRVCQQTAAIAFSNTKFWVAALLLRDRTDTRSLSIQLRAADTQSQFKYLLRLLADHDFRDLVVKKDWLNEHFWDRQSFSAHRAGE